MTVQKSTRYHHILPDMIRSLWAYRWFILGSVQREFQSRYRGSLLGAAWPVISPLAMIVVYLTVFSHLMKARLPGLTDTMAYGIFLCVGIFTWGYFVEVLNRCINIFIENANLLKKSPFPKASLPLIALLSATLNFAIVFGIFLIFLLITFRFPGPILLAMIPLLIIQQILAVGLGVLLGTLNVFFRDVGQVMTIVIQFWFWLTPIVYPPSVLPEWIRNLVLTWNPMAQLIAGYQGILLTGAMPDYAAYWPPTLLALLTFVVGYWTFKRLSGEMVDEL